MSIDDDGEATFVNIVGEIDPRQVGKLASQYNIDHLDSARVQLQLDSKYKSKQ